MAWSPSDSTAWSNVIAWYDGDDSGTVTDTSGAVSQWDDKKNSNNLTVSNGSPTTGSVTIGGLNAIDLDGNDSLVKSSATDIGNGAPAMTIIGVVKLRTGYSGIGIVAGYGNSGAGDAFSFGQEGGSSNQELTNRMGNGYVESDTTWANNEEVVFVTEIPASSNYSNINWWHDGSSTGVTNNNTNSLSFAGTKEIRVGTNTGGGGDYADAAIGEILFFDAVLSQSEREEFEGYLAHKWGLEANLPAAHPYKSAPPSSGISGTGTGSTSSTSTASGELDLNGSGAGPTSATGAGAGSVSVTGSGSVSVSASGAGAGSVEITAASTGSTSSAGSGAGTLGSSPITGTGSGSTSSTSSGAGVLSIAGSGSGTTDSASAASASLEISGSGSGATGSTGAANANLAITGAGSGSTDSTGTGAGTSTPPDITGTGTGSTSSTSASTAKLTLVASGSGSTQADSAATGALSVSGAGTGQASASSAATGRLRLVASGSGQASATGAGFGQDLSASTTPTERTCAIDAEDRSLSVSSEARTLDIPEETRTLRAS